MQNPTTAWPFATKLLFRFFFIYFIFYAAPWTWLDDIPYYNYVNQAYYWLIDQLVNASNTYLFKTYKELVQPNGSGDTSWAWTQMWMMLSISLLAAAIWTVADQKKQAYPRWNYFLCQVIRYNLAITAFTYGIIKIYALQMITPNQSQLATPLGEFLPMRFSWLFIGYSTPYQVFSGVTEVVAGLLLFFRRTTTAGVLMSLAVFTNVMVLNLTYDIPVKLMSTHLVAMSLFLLVQEQKRVFSFVLNKPVPPASLYEITFTKKWQRVGYWLAKIYFVVFVMIVPSYKNYERYQKVYGKQPDSTFALGSYDVTVFARNADTLPALVNDSTRWTQLILDTRSGGSLYSGDSLFARRYGRLYFGYFPDTVNSKILFRKNGSDQSDSLFTLRYEKLDSVTIKVWGPVRGDSLYMIWRKNGKQYRLAEKQFHWLSEYNR